MTEFKRAQTEVDELSLKMQKLQEQQLPQDPTTQAAALGDIKAALEGDLRAKMVKFSKRLTEVDPVSGDLRYGESMRSKVGTCSLLRARTLLVRYVQDSTWYTGS